MKKVKKTTALLLCLVMVLALFSGCSTTAPAAEAEKPAAEAEKPAAEAEAKPAEEAEAKPAEEAEADPVESEELEHLDISMAYYNFESDLNFSMEYFDVPDGIMETIQEKFNVTITPVTVTYDDVDTKTTMWAATDSLPDFFVDAIHGTPKFIQWAKEGVIAPLPADLSAYPNLEKHLEAYGASNGCVVDGKYYCIPRLGTKDKYRAEEGTMIAYRTDWAEAAGITEEPKTMDEFIDMLQKIVDSKPEGKSVCGLDATLKSLCDWAIPYSDARATVDGNIFQWIEQDGSYIPAYFGGETLGSNLLPTWNVLRELYSSGLLNPDIALSDDASVSASLFNDESAAVITSAGWLGDANYNWRNSRDTYFFDHVKVMNVIPSIDGNFYLHEFNSMCDVEFMFNGGIDEAKMERILMIWDFLCTDEGIDLCYFGIGCNEPYQDMHYVGEDGRATAYYNDEGKGVWYCAQNLFGVAITCEPESATCKNYLNSGLDPEWYDVREAFYNMAKNDSAEAKPVVEGAPMTFVALGHKFGLHITDDAMMIMSSSEPVEDVWAGIIADYQAVDDLDGAIELLNAVME